LPGRSLRPKKQKTKNCSLNSKIIYLNQHFPDNEYPLHPKFVGTPNPRKGLEVGRTKNAKENKPNGNYNLNKRWISPKAHSLSQ